MLPIFIMLKLYSNFTQNVKPISALSAIMILRYRKGEWIMQRIELLMTALEYIEKHLRDEIKTENIAAACFCSKSTLEKLFRSVHNISVHDYIVRRRMTLAARKLSAQPELPILDIAVEYGYSTHESFARAFEQVWNCKPSEFRRARFTELFPRLSVPPQKGDYYVMQRRHVDINELYDLFQERKDCFFVLCDIKHMLAINDISRKAGDLAILEQMRRMTAASGENDITFRIGGDEFCILTASNDASYAGQIAEKIRSMNGQTFAYEDQKIPLNLYVTTVSIKECNRYDEVFAGLHNALKASKA